MPWLARDVSFPDRNHGWLSLGPAGALARTIDGGRTWSLTPKIPVCRRLSVETEIAFTNPTHGYLVCLAEPGAGMERKWLFATTDGGETWTRTGVPVGGSTPSLGASPTGGVAMDATPDGIAVQSAPGALWRHPVTTDWGPTGIAWPARRPIYVALGRALVKSTDGGRGWRQLLPINHEQPQGPTSFANRLIGYGAIGSGPLGDPGSLLETVDGGRSWVQIARFPYGVTHLRATPGGVAVETLRRTYFVTRLAGVTRIQRIGRLRHLRSQPWWRPIPPARFPDHDPLLRWHVQTRRAGNTVWALLTSVSNMNQQAYVAYRSTDGGRTFSPIFAGSYSDPDLYDLLGLPQIDAFSGPFTALPDGGAVLLGSCTVCDPRRWTALVTRSGRTWTRTTYAGAMPTTVPAWLTRP